MFTREIRPAFFFSLMDKRYFIELTNKLYRLTLLFPKQEALRHKIRGVADEILVDLVVILEGGPKEKREAAFNVERNIEILDVLLQLAKKQDWVLGREIVEIFDEYLVIKKEVEEFNDLSRKELRETEKESIGVEEKKESLPEVEEKKEDVQLNKRQEDIIAFIEKNDQVQVKDIQEIFPKVTKRTLRRDLNTLLEKGVVQRSGKGNRTYYSSVRTAVGH